MAPPFSRTDGLLIEEPVIVFGWHSHDDQRHRMGCREADLRDWLSYPHTW